MSLFKEKLTQSKMIVKSYGKHYNQYINQKAIQLKVLSMVKIHLPKNVKLQSYLIIIL
jgi:hypothetical protein